MNSKFELQCDGQGKKNILKHSIYEGGWNMIGNNHNWHIPEHLGVDTFEFISTFVWLDLLVFSFGFDAMSQRIRVESEIEKSEREKWERKRSTQPN